MGLKNCYQINYRNKTEISGVLKNKYKLNHLVYQIQNDIKYSFLKGKVFILFKSEHYD